MGVESNDATPEYRIPLAFINPIQCRSHVVLPVLISPETKKTDDVNMLMDDIISNTTNYDFGCTVNWKFIDIIRKNCEDFNSIQHLAVGIF